MCTCLLAVCLQCTAEVDAFVNFDELGPDWDMLSRGLFISCLLDAAEHDKPQVQVRRRGHSHIIPVGFAYM
jgi:hypothetical protein